MNLSRPAPNISLPFYPLYIKRIYEIRVHYFLSLSLRLLPLFFPHSLLSAVSLFVVPLFSQPLRLRSTRLYAVSLSNCVHPPSPIRSSSTS